MALTASALSMAGCKSVSPTPSDTHIEQPSPYPSPTSLALPPKGSICGTDDYPPDYLRRIEGCEVNYSYFLVELSTGLSDPTLSSELMCGIGFLLPKGWFCLRSPISDEIYLGGSTGLFNSRIYIYDSFGSCVGAMGIRRSSSASTEGFQSYEDVRLFFSDINSNPYYRFTTDEYYFPVSISTLQFSDRFSVPAITEVFYSREYLESSGRDSELDSMNLGILSRHEGDSLYLCFEFDSRALNFIQLSDIAGSILWGNIQEA